MVSYIYAFHGKSSELCELSKLQWYVLYYAMATAPTLFTLQVYFINGLLYLPNMKFILSILSLHREPHIAIAIDIYYIDIERCIHPPSGNHVQSVYYNIRHLCTKPPRMLL
jgi:hypothetical protein